MTEPLLTPSIADYIQEIKKRGHEVNVTTNGYLLPEKAQELVDSNLDSIQISLDGPAKINDWIRGKKGFFERAIRGIKKVEGKVPIRINYTVSNLNYQYLEEFTEAIDKKVKIDLVKFQFLDFVSEEMSKKQERYAFKQTVSSVDKNTDPQKVDAAILKEQIQRIKNRKYKNIGKIAFIPNLSKREEIEAYFNNEGKPLKNHSACRWPFNQIAINTNGDVFFHMRCFNYNIGNVNKESISKIFNGEKARFFRGEFRKAGMCFPACTRCCGVMFC
jgi:MoaA/NifB/PqqE/SkfB family radical SAM enzyme